MTDTPADSTSIGADAVFRAIMPDEKSTAMEEYRAKQLAELDKTARLRAARLARQAEKNKRG
jgi:hypothetical protein